MKNVIILCILSLLFFTSCASYISMVNIEDNIKKIELDMSKQEVIEIMGKSYEALGAEKKDDILIEKIGFKPTVREVYILIFINDKLTEWNKKWIPSHELSAGTYTTDTDKTVMRTHLDAHRKAMLSTASSEAQRQHINFHMDAHERAILGE